MTKIEKNIYKYFIIRYIYINFIYNYNTYKTDILILYF